MSSSPEKTLLLVVGMHRSGTSVLTHVLQLLGAELGDDLLPPEAGVNDRGFWEHQQVVALNERILEVLDHPWYDVRPLPENWMEHREVTAHSVEAKSLLDDTFGKARFAAIKDPRLCLLLPFWERAAREAGWSPKVILASRTPAEVAASLCRRDPLNLDTALLLWLRYTREADRSSRDLPRTAVDYGALLQDWRATVTHMGEMLGLDWPGSGESTARHIDNAIDPTLRHQHRRVGENDSRLLLLATRIHQLLTQDPSNFSALDACWSETRFLLRQPELKERALAVSVRQLFSLNHRLHELGHEHTLALETIRRRDQELQNRTDEWERMGKELDHCRAVVEERDHQLEVSAQRIATVEASNHLLKENHRELQEKYHALKEQHEELMRHPAIRLARKLFMGRS